MNLLLLEPDEVMPDGSATVAGRRAAHLTNVLRAVPGKQIRVGIVGGPVGLGTVRAVGSGSVAIDCAVSETPPRPSVDLMLALPRPKILRRLWPQLAALGVGRIILTNAARVERNYFDTHLLAPAAYRPLLLEGLQQACDTHLPLVTIHRRFRPFVEDELDALCPDGVRLVAHPDAATSVGEALRAPAAGRVLVAIGPEGGWVDFELGLLAAHRFGSVHMGPRTLRADTACIALVASVYATLGSTGQDTSHRMAFRAIRLASAHARAAAPDE
jgi:16S rRNA (uracil1498-N3)-methyltransferase